MRWKISHRGHDPRQIDLLAVLALFRRDRRRLSISCSGASDQPSTTAFIVPSQSVRW